MEYSGLPYTIQANPRQMSPIPSYFAPPAGHTTKKIIGIIIIVITFLLLAGIIGYIIYLLKKPTFTPFSGGGQCNNGNISIPEPTPGVSPPDGISCYTLSGYNTYPRATIKAPTMTSTDTLFTNVNTFNGATMTGELCTDKCDGTPGCVCATCKYAQGVTNQCSCTGYNKVPTALAADPCIGGCNYVYVSSEHV